MADPFTWAMSAALNAAGSIMEGNAEYAQGMHEAGVAEENARRARDNARQVRFAGQQAEEAQRRQIRRSLGRTVAAAANTGTGGAGYGSNFAILRQASTEGELDALNVRYQHETEAYGSELEALNQGEVARAARRRARGARTAGYIGAVSSVLDGYTSYSGQRALVNAGRPARRA